MSIVKSLYFGPYEIVSRWRARPWFPGVTIKYANHLNALFLHSLLVTTILYGLYFNFIDDSPLPGGGYGFVFLFAVATAANAYLLDSAKLDTPSRGLKASSILIFAVFTFQALSGWHIPGLR